MRHKKKRASQQHARHPDRLDYSDDISDPANLDSQSYQDVIRAHLNEYENRARDQADEFSTDMDDLSQHVSKGLQMPSIDRHFHQSPPLPSKLTKKTPKTAVATNAKAGNRTNNRNNIWNTTTNEERERIKEFWLNLGEEERKSLVKVEKEAVLKKMKEQQKHSCSCSVCGRKRTAIEEELEVLYDAYYEELEQYANQQQFPPQSSITSPRHHTARHHRPGKITEVLHSDDSDGSFEAEDGEDLSEADLLTDDDLSAEEEDYSDGDYVEDHAPPEFFKFGHSLEVNGGILTVAEDLLKNDGKQFIEMMEQLAERRMQREEEAAMEARQYDEEEDDDDYDDEEDDEDIESEDYDDEEEEQEALTEEQRMAEGRRMFQIFAARMFEQRVLTAYREKVAQERQAQLLQELEMEDSREKEREAKKAKEKEKKKDKKRQQQLKKEEEKARKEAERLAEESAARAEEERKAEETRKKKEEQRLKREAQKKTLEAERLRKEEEKKKRIADEKAKETKRLESLAREKKLKEESLRLEREAKELSMREAKAKKEAQKVQREGEHARAPMVTNAQSNTTSTGARKISPPVGLTTSTMSASPAVPKAHGSTTQVSSRLYQDHTGASSLPRNIPVPAQQHRTRTPSAISPQQQTFGGSHQNSFPRAVLGHPPSMPVPLPPPGIGSHGPPSAANHDPFAFNSPQTQHTVGLHGLMQPRTNGHSVAQIPNIQGPPGVFASVPALASSTSPQPRIGTPHQTARLNSNPGFAAFAGLGSATTPREEEADLTFTRRTSHIPDAAIGTIGRPSQQRTSSSALPAPIQRPTSIAPPMRTGFETGNVMGSRALLDDDDPVMDARSSHGTTSMFNAASSWNPSTKSELGGFGSAALNGPEDEPIHPIRNTHPPQPTLDRWGSVGSIGTKPVNGQVDDRVSKNSINWGF